MEVIGYNHLSWPIIYLGVLLGGNLRANSFCDGVVGRVSWQLDHWKVVLTQITLLAFLRISCPYLEFLRGWLRH